MSSGGNHEYLTGILSGSTNCKGAKGKKSEDGAMQNTYHKGYLPWRHPQVTSHVLNNIRMDTERPTSFHPREMASR